MSDNKRKANEITTDIPEAKRVKTEENEHDFAPRRKPVKGVKTLAVLSIKWADQKRYASSGACRNMANQVRKFYLKNSRGMLQFKIVKTAVVRVPYKSARKNINKAEVYCRRRVKADIYCIINNGVRGYSNAGGNTAHLRGALARTGNHEVGHLLGLGHSGRYYRVKNKWKFENYGDRQSVMGKYASSLLTAPQYYHQGWLFEDECAAHDLEGPEKIYHLRRITQFSERGELAAVRIKLPAQRDAMVSFPNCKRGKSCVALHLTNGGGSQQVATFGNEYFDTRFTGLHIKKLGFDEETGLLTISIKKIAEPDEPQALDEDVEEIDDDDVELAEAEDSDLMHFEEL